MPVSVEYLHPLAGPDHVGIIPLLLSEHNELPAAKQLNIAYAHGGGWHPMKKWKLLDDNSIQYPGNPPYKPLAKMKLRDETIFVYESAWVAIVQPDRSFEVSRMD